LATHIKKESRYLEQDPAKVAAFKTAFSQLDPKKIVYVDESGMGDDERPLRGWSQKGALCIGKKPGLSKVRLNMVAGLLNKHIIAPFVYTVTSTAEVIELWFTKSLLPTLAEGMTIIMDNAPIHRKKILEAHAANAKCNILWLPPYSPELNDIEPWWAVIKHKIRQALLLHPNILDAATIAYQQIP
jgi:isftu1 transposase